MMQTDGRLTKMIVAHHGPDRGIREFIHSGIDLACYQVCLLMRDRRYEPSPSEIFH
ncbi:hypothetical protein DDI_3702 [Dickeya dianthicola RNS04.9]|nr:hypothetical protein DDI_3702 [Dickeya dianthicola RNS04.9]